MSININQELSQNFIDFSYEANSNRAFADARDGLKPGQRACLWEMYIKGYSSNKPHVKSAKISGGTVASWWPHGDVAVYDTFARMSQPWINNIPEVDWHGANGSIQISGDPAASRYTEARLAKSTEDGLFQGIKKNNVPMKFNFSEDEEWPEVLPALYPRLMVNGCQGIGSTVANVWLPHSLNEIADSIFAYLSTGEIDYDKLAPSFPSGGIIINKKDLPTIYKTGKGKCVLRGKIEIKNDYIYITELPYQVYVEPFIDSVKQLITKEEITGITNILNKSNKKQMLIEIECDKAPLDVLNQLYSKTDLQKSFSANQYALVSKTPKLLTYKDYLDIYLNHNYECIKRECTYDLDKSTKRLEIIKGLIKALEDIDNIIQLIKKSESSSKAKEQLIAVYAFTENQAKAIIDMKLGRLAHLEKVELNTEREELISTIADCKDIISNSERQKKIYLERFTAFVKKYSNPRKTKLTQIDPPSKEKKEAVFIEPEKCVVVLTAGGNIKRIPSASFRTQNRNTKGVKTQDDITSMVLRTNTVDNLMVFTNLGKMYRLSVNDVPVGTNVSKGQSVSSLVEMELGEKPVLIYSIYHNSKFKYLFFVTKRGTVKKTLLSEYIDTKKKGGIIAVKLREGDSLAAVSLINEENVILVSRNGMGIRFKSTDVPATSRATIGIKGINIKDEDEVMAGIPVRDETDELAVFVASGQGKKFKLAELQIQMRGGKGLSVGKEEIVSAVLVSPEDNILLCGEKNSVCISASEIPNLSRTAIGNQLIKANQLISVSKI